GIASARMCGALDLVEAIVDEKDRSLGRASVGSRNAELPTIYGPDPVRQAHLQLAALFEPRHGLVDDQRLRDPRTASFRDRDLELAVVGARRIDMRRHHFAGGDLKFRYVF